MVNLCDSLNFELCECSRARYYNDGGGQNDTFGSQHNGESRENYGFEIWLRRNQHLMVLSLASPTQSLSWLRRVDAVLESTILRRFFGQKQLVKKRSLRANMRRQDTLGIFDRFASF